jgi:very-short-patch-repair endonuclease
MTTPSVLELAFERLWHEFTKDHPRLYTLEREVTLPPRKYRYDFLIVGTNVLIEIQGGTWSRRPMGHSTGEGQFRDYAKTRYAQMKGYLVLPYDRKQATSKAEVGILYEYICKRYPNLLA